MVWHNIDETRAGFGAKPSTLNVAYVRDVIQVRLVNNGANNYIRETTASVGLAGERRGT